MVTFVFKSYAEIRAAEIAAGHDSPLASCVNLSSPGEIEEGCALYVGSFDGLRVTAIIGEAGDLTVVAPYEIKQFADYASARAQRYVAQFHWAVAASC
jgi:hypothetical protein